MTVSKPFRRTCRPFVDGHYSRGGQSEYINHPKFADSPSHYVRAFLLLQGDLQNLFDYIEPDYINLKSYSFRLHEILTRACIEVEANAKAILIENGYTGRREQDYWNMEDYRNIEQSHRLSAYRVAIPGWKGERMTRQPFEAWSEGKSPPWYKAYNNTKHDRHSNFQYANLQNATDAVCGLVAILSSQFHQEDFAPVIHRTVAGGGMEGFDSAIGSYFEVQFPNDWPEDERYEFDWQAKKDDPDPFDMFEYS